MTKTATAAPDPGDDDQDIGLGEMPGMTFNNLFEAASMADDLVANAIYRRFDWMARRMETGRDIYKECGYPVGDSLDVDVYRDMYDRDAIAARVVQVLPKESWQVQPSIYEDEDPEVTTEFEQAWVDLHKNLRGQSWYQDEEGSPIWDYLLRADILSGIGRYGIILLGINDGKSLDQPLEEFRDLDSGSAPGTEGLYGTQPLRGDATGYDGYTQKMLEQEGMPAFSTLGSKNNNISDAKDGYEEPVGQDADGRKLIYMKVFDETCAQITRYERDANNPRFGMPQMYLVTFNDPRNGAQGGAGLPVASAHVHWSRVVHVADNAGANDVLGYPRMKQVYNRLWDAFKTYGASGEGFWQMAFAMLSLETNPALGADFKVDVEGIREQLAKLRSGFQRHLVTAGMTAKTLPPALSDPTPYINVFIEAICIFMGCPVRVFKGSERGELASTQDDSSWNDRLAHRQKFYITPKIIVSFIDRLIVAKVLPEPEGYSVVWPDLESLSDKDKATIALQVTQALAAYISGQVENLMTPLDFVVNVLKFPHELAKQIVESAQDAQEKEEQQTIEEEPTPEETQEQTDAEVPTHEKEAAAAEAVANVARCKDELLMATSLEEISEILANYSPSQARGQAGSRQGGQFIKQPGVGGSSIKLVSESGPLGFGSHEPSHFLPGGGGNAPGGQSGGQNAHQARFRREGLVREPQGGLRVIEKGNELANHVHGNAKLAKPTKLQQMKIEAMNPNGLVGGKVKIPWEMVHKRDGNKYLTVPEKKAEMKAMFPHHDVEFPAYKAAKSLGMAGAPVLVMKNPPPPKTSVKEGDRSLEAARQPNLSRAKDLSDSKPTSVVKLGGGINGSYIVHLENGVRGVWKPRGEEATNMRGNVPNKTSYAREAAAYSVAKTIGLQDLVPPTVERTMKFSFGRLEGPEQKGSFQLFFDGKDGSKKTKETKYDGDKDLARASAFDVLIANTDRHHKNWMIENGGSKKLALIDHGLAFPTTHGGMRSWLLNEAARKNLKVPQEVLGWNGYKIANAMRKHGLDEGAVLVMRDRLAMLHKAATANRGFNGLREKTNAQDY